MSRVAAGIAEEQTGSSLRDWWLLLKPNVMQLVVFTSAAGLYLAPGSLHPLLTVVALLCIAVGAGACAALNNAWDTDIDALMARTRRRPTACGRIDRSEAAAFGGVLALFSVAVMGLALNWLAAGLLAFTILFYVVVYTMLLKRRTPQNIVIGGLAGALPPLVGWSAVTGAIDTFPLLLVLVIFLWTPAHFWALALNRAEEYARAGVPMLPVVAGATATRNHILGYAGLTAGAALIPALAGFTGSLYGVGALLLGAGFLFEALRLRLQPSPKRAMRLFAFSILYLFVLFLLLVVDHAFPLGGTR